MRQAIDLARQAMYVPAPNPRVGCVIVRDGQVIGRGSTRPVGQAHAEVVALQDAKSRGQSIERSTVYISLEPCSHHGRTPPCVDALIRAKPERVVFAHFDPNPSVGGRGMRILKEAGIDVTVGVCADDALEINPGFVSRMTRGVPFVWLKTACSIDGRTALLNGKSQWITGPEARRDGHHWRARSCMVLTGIGTVRSDNPRMNVRDVQTQRQPMRGVIDPGFEIDEQAAILDGTGAVLFVGAQDPAKSQRLVDRGVQVVYLPDPGGNHRRVDFPAVMRWMGEHEINEVHGEAGSGINGALMQAGCVDQLLVYMAPMIIGEGMNIARLPEIDTLEGAYRYEFVDTQTIGDDVRLVARDMQRWVSLRQALHLTPSMT